MLKNISQLEITVETKIGRLLVDSDTSLCVVKEMLFQFLKYIGQIEDDIRTQQVNEEEKELIKE
jgi:hypothetical protein